MTVQFEILIREMCGLGHEHCAPVAEPKNSEVLGKIDDLFDTNYASARDASVILNNCYAAGGGICVITDRSGDIRLGLFSEDGYRSGFSAHPETFRNMIGYYINDERIHDELLRSSPDNYSPSDASNVAFLKQVIGSEDEAEHGLSYLLVLAFNWIISLEA